MASMINWCYFFLTETSMAKQKTKNIMSRFLQGWQQIFGGERQEENQPRLKPFPQDHFYYPEELDFLSKKEDLTTIEKWALATGKWAYEQGTSKRTDSQYSPVKWQDGLMATWIDSRIVPDTPGRQAEKLALLKEEGFEIPDKYDKVITNYEASRLVGSYFHKGNDVVKVEDYDKGHLLTDTPKFNLSRWDSNNLSFHKETMGYADFKNEIGKSIHLMDDADKNNFTKRLDALEQGKKQFNNVLASIGKSYPPVMGGTVPLDLQTVHNVAAFNGKAIPTSWSLGSNQTLHVSVITDQANKPNSIVINENNAFKYQSLLDTVGKVVENERVNGITYSLVSLLGNDFGENKIYAKPGNAPLLHTNDGLVNAVVATKDGRTIAFNLDTHKEVSLNGKDANFLMLAMMNEGYAERQRLRDLTSVPLMKDYVESMRDKENLLSGEWDYIPSHTTVDKLFRDYQNHEEEFHAYTRSFLPMAVEDRNEMLADLETSHFAFNQEMKKMVDAYNSHSYSFTDDDVKKMEQLDSILGGKDNNQVIRHHKVSQPQELTVQEAALRDSLVEKMQKNGMDVVTDVDEAKKVHQEASHEMKEMGTRTLKRMDKIGEELKGRELTQEQQAVVGVYSGKEDNLYFNVRREDKNKVILMRQGNDFHAGTKHSVYGHYDTNKGVITADDILLIPDVIAKGERKISANGKIEYKYNNPQNNVSYKVITQSEKGHEVFNDFYTNKKVRPSVTSSLNNETKTNLIAHNNNGQTFTDAKVQQKEETAKSDGNKLNEFKTSKGEIWGFTTDGKIYLDPTVANAETPIHEYTHIWADALRENNPKEWSNIVGLMKSTTLWQQVKNDYPELMTEDDVADEVLATYSGKRGAERLRKEMSKMTNHGNMNEKAAASRSLGRMEFILDKFWKAVSDFLHIHFSSAEQVADRPLKDLLDGVDPRVYIKGSRKEANDLSSGILPLREQRMQKGLSDSLFVEPSLLKINTDGRWHTQEHLEKMAYQEYGSILANSKGLNQSLDGQKSVPMDLNGRKYSGATAMMLNIASCNNGYKVPVFVNISAMSANSIRVKGNAVGIPVITKQGVENVYNIEQTDYPIKHPHEFNNMMLNQVLESRLSSENKEAIEALVNNNRFTTKTVFDSSVGSASYSSTDNTIHVAPVGKYEKKDGFLQDLSEGLVMSTRKAEPASSRFENMLKEGLIVHLGSGLVGQKYGYDVGETAGSKFWKERLKNDPTYTKAVVNAAERSSEKIIDYVEKLQKGQNQSSNLDLRSTTPIDIDVDGNGIVENDENLEPDKKQGSNEENDNNQDEVHHQQRRFHRGM